MDYLSKYIISNKKVGDKMNIKVYKSWTIRSYPYGFILAKAISTKDKHGKDSVRYDNETYHNSIESCLKNIEYRGIGQFKGNYIRGIEKRFG